VEAFDNSTGLASGSVRAKKERGLWPRSSSKSRGGFSRQVQNEWFIQVAQPARRP